MSAKPTMASSVINWTESKAHPDGLSNPSTDGSLFNRRIGFHLARKQLTGLSDPMGKKSNNGSEFLDNGLDPELNFGITFRKIGAGLENLGNTCFLNSVLQCLTYTEPLAAYLQSGKHQNSCRTAGFCALCAIQKHVSRALQSTGRILAPKDLVSNLRRISRSFRNARQEDAHEYMVNLLESMHKCCLPSGVPSESPSAYEKSLVHKIFGGNLRSQVKCMQCSFCSNKFDPFLDLSLEIANAESLYKALAHFTAKEQLDGGERHYNCQQCKQKVRALKQLTIHKAPYVLTIHLKRFGSLIQGQKINKKIPFGPTLDLKPFVSGPYDGDLKYTLYGVLVHAGWSTHSGHYYCFVRTSSGMWYSLDDNQVVQVNERKVLEQKAYMLFYVRDRESFGSKKAADAVKKENVAINPIGRSNGYPSFNQGFREAIPNGLIDKRLNHPSPFVAVALRDTLNAGSSKETVMKEASNQKIKDLIIENYSLLNKDHMVEQYSKLRPLKNLVNGHSVLQNGGGCMPQSVLPDKTSIDNGKNASKASILDFSARRKGKIDPAISVCGENRDNSQTQVGTVVGSLATKTVNHDHIIVDSVPAGSSSLPVLTRISLHKKSFDSGPHRKVNKKIIKRYVTGTNLSTSILFGSSLIMRKKKHKRRNKCTTGIKILSSRDVDCISMDMEPSTSEKFTTMPLGSSSKKKEKGSVVNNVSRNYNDDLLADVVNKEFGERISQNDVTDDLPQKSHTVASAGNLAVSVQSNSLKDSRGNPNQNGFMSMLTRGLDESTVARWDEGELCASQMTEASVAKSLTIGYVADEWDEEYDRGKRKKVKISKNNTGGPNLFQEIVSSKAKVMAKLISSNSGNQPFRIR